MDDSFGGQFNATTTTNAGANAEQKAEGLAPVLIKQILESPEGNFQMWGMTFGMVTCVAIVRGIDTSSTKITYLLEDNTGQIDAHYWLEEGDTFKTPDVMINNYARVCGTIRTHGGKKTLMIFKMRSITVLNEVTTHLLEVLNARYKAEEFSKKGAGSGSDFEMGASNPAGFSVQTNSLGLEGKQLAVYMAIKNHGSEEGISMPELTRKFSHISTRELQDMIDFMTQEGHIYTSIDSDHFLSTDC